MGEGPVVLAAGGVGEDSLLPVVEGHAPWVVDVGLDVAFEAEALGIEAPCAAIVAALRAVGGFDLAVEEASFEKVEGAGGVGAVRGDCVMGVVGVEAVHEDLDAVGAVVVVVVHEEAQVGFLGDIHSLGRELEADGEMEVFGEDGLLVGASVAVGVLEDEELVVGA